MFTSSADFSTTLSKVIEGLNRAGFSEKDYRCGNYNICDLTGIDIKPDSSNKVPDLFEGQNYGQTSSEDSQTGDAVENIDVSNHPFVPSDEDKVTVDSDGNVVEMGDEFTSFLSQAQKQTETYNNQVETEAQNNMGGIPASLLNEDSIAKIRERYSDDVKEILLPQFVESQEEDMFGDRGRALVTRSLLTQEFELSKQNTEINFESVDTEFYKIDLEDSNIPKKIKVNKAAAEKFVQAVDLLPPQARVSQIGKKVCEDLNEKYDEIASDEIEAYVGRIIQSLNAEQLDTFKENYISYVERIKDKIDSLLEDYRVQRLEKLLDRDEIRVENVTKFSDTIILLNKTSEYSKTLYDAELNDMNGEEINAIEKIMALDNVKWWHRNGSKNNIWAYCINGYVNHYPDFIIETTKGKILFVEYKGYQLATKENELKLRLGELLEAYGNKWFKYYMVFDKEAKFKGSFNLQDALDDISYQ